MTLKTDSQEQEGKKVNIYINIQNKKIMKRIIILMMLTASIYVSTSAQNTDLESQLNSCECFVNAMKKYADINNKVWDLVDYAPNSMSRGDEPVKIQHDCSTDNPTYGWYSHSQVVNNINKFQPQCDKIKSKLNQKN